MIVTDVIEESDGTVQVIVKLTSEEVEMIMGAALVDALKRYIEKYKECDGE